MSFDSDRGKIVLFGGNTASPDEAPALLGDTWELAASGQAANGAVVPTSVTAVPNPAFLNIPLVTVTFTLSGPAPSPAGVSVDIGVDGTTRGVVGVQAGVQQGSAGFDLSEFNPGLNTVIATANGVTVTTALTVV